MPRKPFLENDERLKKNNLLAKAKALKNRATRPIENLPLEVDKYFDDIEIKIELDKLRYLMDKLAIRMSKGQSRNFANALDINPAEIKHNAMSKYRDLVKNYVPNGNQKDELLAYIDSAAQNNNITFEEVADRVENLLPQEHKSKLSKNEVSFIPKNEILRRFDEFIVISSVELSNAELEAIGDDVNNFKSKYEYVVGDNITEVLYSDQTADLISILNNTKTVDGKLLTDDEIREYENALMRANELFGNPTIDLDQMVTQKNELDKAITHDQQKNANAVLEGMGLDPNVVKSTFSPENGPYYEIVDNKEEEFNNVKESLEFNLSNDTKKCLKEFINKLHEFGYDKDGITGEQKNKIYGLRSLYEAGLKYKKAISSNNQADRIKAIAYAKEVYDADKNIKEVYSLIDKYMPVSHDNLSYPGNVDSLRTDGMPPEYRLDYIRASHLANIYSLANLIEEKKWDIDDFLDRPMHFLKQYYKEDYQPKIDPQMMHDGLTGDDLIFNIGRYSLTENIDNMVIAGGRIVEGLVDSEKDRNIRNQNAAIAKAFTDTIFEPYNIANGYREYVAKGKALDSIIINPNITFKDLRIKSYNPDTLKFDEPDNERFDEIAYIKDRKESLTAIKDRIENSILKYMKNEIELVNRNKEAGVMYLTSEGYVDLCQKAVAKILITRKDEAETEAYQELLAFINNKQFYVQALVEEINQNGKFSDYMIVKNTKNNPPTFDNQVYNPTHFDNGNKYKDILTDYDKFVKDNKVIINNQLSNFINSQNNINNKINSELQAYNNILRKYESEVKKLYGENYEGVVDNSRSDKLLDLFRQKNEAYKRFLNLKANALDGIEERVKNGLIPISYLEDRKLQLENDDFKAIPPLFRTDKPYTMDEYIRLKHPNDYNNLSNAEKEVIFNSYKKTISRIENDFFTRKFLISKDLTFDKTDTVEIQEFEKDEIAYAKLNERLLEAQLIGVSLDLIDRNNISANNTKFDEIKFLREHNQQIADFKKNIDKKIIELAKTYNTRDPDEMGNLPDIVKVIDVFQKSTLKYLLTVGNMDISNPLYKDLYQLVVDGSGYINKVIEEENNAINQRNLSNAELKVQEVENSHVEDGIIDELEIDDLEDNISFNLKELGVNDYNINNYSNIINEFNKYYNDKIKTNFYKLPNELEEEEIEANNNLSEEYEKIYNDRPNKSSNIDDDIIDNVVKASPYSLFEENKKEVKDRLCDFFSRGLISEDYLKERFRRLDNNDFTIPKFFTIDKMQSVNDYVRDKYPNEYNNLTKNEKNLIYNRYKLECIESRRQFILNKFLVEKGLTKFNNQTCPTYEAYKEINTGYERINNLDELDDFGNIHHKRNITEKTQVEINLDDNVLKNKKPKKLSIIDEDEEIIPSLKNDKDSFSNRVYESLNEKKEADEDIIVNNDLDDKILSK